MGSKNRVIIDTDPGVDDILALLLAFSSGPEDIEVPLISLTFGNIEVKSCLRNAVSMFHVIEREIEWRRKHGKPEGFEALKSCKPIIAVGADKPLDDEKMLGDYFHGKDGLGGVHTSHPHHTPVQAWESLFDPLPEGSTASADGLESTARHHKSFIPSKTLAHREMLRILKESDPNTVTIVAVGPLTNVALAAAEDPETFLRVKELVVMGGATDACGNVTPNAEFNIFADPVAAARVFALTSQRPLSTMPKATPTSTIQTLPPATLSNPLKIKLAALDLTEHHRLLQKELRSRVAPLIAAGSPLAEWVSVIVEYIFAKLESLHIVAEGEQLGMSLHDPVCVWYALTSNSPLWTVTTGSPVDMRVETTGQWTRGMCVVDRRMRQRRDNDEPNLDDHGEWLGKSSGNRVDQLAGSPGADKLGPLMMDLFFGPQI